MDDTTVNNREGYLYLTGRRGYSAYEVAVQNGFVGTEEEWLESLRGEPGTPFGELTPEERELIRGSEGKSAYEVAVDNGYIGTEEQWVNSFLTPDGYYNKETLDYKLNKIKQEENQVKYIFPKSHSLSGDYNIIQVDGKNILIDCFVYEGWSEFKAVLDSYNISHIDIFICTHFHADHIGNFNNLVTNGYINEETTIYFPKYTFSLWENDSSYTTTHGYLEAMSTVEQYSLSPIQPTEGMEVILNDNTKFTFYNTDDEYSYETFTQQNKYNNTSLIVLFKHYDIYNVYWGDCYNQPVQWLYGLGLLPENIGIWKMGHHGVDYTGQSAFEVLRKLKINYAIQELGRNYLSAGHSYSNGTASELQKLGVPVYVSAYNDNNIEIITNKNLINLISGTDNLTSERSRYKTVTWYVDPVNYSSDKQDGSQSYPFSNLNQCLGNITRNNAISYTINLADGDYNNEFISYDETKDISTLYGVTNTVVIQGNSEDKSQVILHHGFNISNCSNITIKDLTINNGGTENGIDVLNSNIVISNIEYTIDTTKTTAHPVAVNSVYSKINMNNCLVSGTNHAIKAEYSNLILDTIQMSEMRYAGFNLLSCIVQAKDCSVTDDSNKLIVNADNNKKSDFINGISLWKGTLVYDDVTPENNTINLNTLYNKFKNIKIVYSTDDLTNNKEIILPITSASTQMARISYHHMNDSYCWFSEEQVNFSGSEVTLSNARQRSINLSSSAIGPEGLPNVTIKEILGL